MLKKIGPDFRVDDMTKTLFYSIASEKLVNILTNGLTYAVNYAESGLCDSLNEFVSLREDLLMSKILVDLNSQNEMSFYSANEACKKIMTELMAKANVEIAVLGKSSIFDKLNTELNKMWKKLGKKTGIQEKKSATLNTSLRKHLFTITHPVNHCVASIAIPRIVSPEFGKYDLLSKLLTKRYLMPELVATGKVSAAEATADISGVFTFRTCFSEDTDESFKGFDSAIAKVCNGEFSNEDLLEAKFNTFREIDAPRGVLEEFLLPLVTGVDDVTKNQVRKTVLNATKGDLVRIARQSLKNARKSMTIYASNEIPNKKKLINDNWRVIDLLELIRNPKAVIDF